MTELSAALKAHFRGRSVLVTGATGLLGSWLCEFLLDAEARVVALIRDGVPDSLFHERRLHDRTVTVRGEVEDLPLLERTLNEYEVVTVFHLAAQTIVGHAHRGPLSTFETNIRGTWNLLEACRRDPRDISTVVASSDKAYGVQEDLPYREEAPLQGRYPYDVSKSCADLITHSYHHTYALPVCVTRCGNLFGGGDLNFNRIVPDTIRSTLEGRPVVLRSDGTFVRDYIYVKDAAVAYLETARALGEGRPISGEAFNFSTETPMTVLEVVDRILRLMERTDLEPVIQGTAQNEIPEQYLDSTKAREILGWTPRWSLDRALEETIEWYRSFLGGSRPA